MHLTMTGEYAIRTMIHLSSIPSGSVAQISDISRSWDIPEKFLRKIVARLAKGGLVKSNRGAHGGVALAKPAEEISLLEVIEEVEGPMSLNKCVENPAVCRRTGTCSVHGVWCSAQDLLRGVLATKSFAELVRLQAPAPDPKDVPS